MKKRFSLFLVMLLFLFGGCSTAAETKPFEIITIDLDTLKTKMENKETFVLQVERDNCPFCAEMNDYIEQTKDGHPDLVLYRIDTTDYHLMREKEGDMTLISDTADGKEFLKIFPYFLYTPTLYRISDGEVLDAGIGYDAAKATVSLWDIDSTIDFNMAKPENVWGFIDEGQNKEESSN